MEEESKVLEPPPAPKLSLKSFQNPFFLETRPEEEKNNLALIMELAGKYGITHRCDLFDRQLVVFEQVRRAQQDLLRI